MEAPDGIHAPAAIDLRQVPQSAAGSYQRATAHEATDARLLELLRHVIAQPPEISRLWGIGLKKGLAQSERTQRQADGETEPPGRERRHL